MGTIARWTVTASGRRVFPLSLDPMAVDADDLAHALARVCRFGGHCSRHYSVAEHSIRVAAMMPPETALVGLLHDADEAYLPDMPGPLAGAFPDFEAAKLAVQMTIDSAFRLYEMPDLAAARAEAKRWDRVLLFDEAAALMAGGTDGWGNPPGESSGQVDFGWSAPAAEQMFAVLLSALVLAHTLRSATAMHVARLRLEAVQSMLWPTTSPAPAPLTAATVYERLNDAVEADNAAHLPPNGEG